MKSRSKVIILVITSLIFAAMLLQMLFVFRELKVYIKVLAYIVIVGLPVIVFVFAYLKKETQMKSCFSIYLLIFAMVAIFAIFKLCGLFDKISDASDVKQIILDSGGWGVMIFLLLQILNIVILPIPAIILHLAGAAVYGAWRAFLLSYIGVLIGSFICYFLGRVFGKKVIIWCIGEEKTKKYSRILGSRGYLAFIFMQILPFFPDDVLCMIAGMTSMNMWKFSVAMILIRPIYIFFACFFGTGEIIPFSGWGIPVWIIIFAVVIFLCIMFCLYYDKLEKVFKRKNSDKKEK